MSLFNPQPGAGNPIGLANPLFKLEYPQSIGVYTSYADAQKAVDSLADQNFPVANIAIVGTDLKLIERVTGRKTWGTVINRGLANGLSTALMITLILFLIEPGRDLLMLIIEAMAIGMLIGVGFAALGHKLTGGQRDFTSITQTVPGKFEILCEHKVAQQARQLLAQGPDARGAAFDPYRQQAGPPAPYAPGPQGQPPYGQAPYGQPPYGQAPYGQAPYGQPPYGQAPYTPTSYGQGQPTPDAVPTAPSPADQPHGGRDRFDPQPPRADSPDADPRDRP